MLCFSVFFQCLYRSTPLSVKLPLCLVLTLLHFVSVRELTLSVLCDSTSYSILTLGSVYSLHQWCYCITLNMLIP